MLLFSCSANLIVVAKKKYIKKLEQKIIGKSISKNIRKKCKIIFLDWCNVCGGLASKTGKGTKYSKQKQEHKSNQVVQKF